MTSVGLRRGVTILALLLFVGLAGCSGGVDYICFTCQEGVRDAAFEERMNISVERSELTVRVSEDGSSRWVIRTTLSGNDVSTLRANPDTVEDVARTAVERRDHANTAAYPVHDGQVSNVSAHLNGSVLVVRFDGPTVAREGYGGTTLVDELHARGGWPRGFSAGANEVVVRGPPGTVVTHPPPGGAIVSDGRAIRWTGVHTPVSSESYVVFGPADGGRAEFATWITLVRDLATWYPSELAFVLPFAVLVGGIAAGLALFSTEVTVSGIDRTGLRAARPWWCTGIAVLAAVTIVTVPLDVGGPWRGVADTFFALPIVPVLLFALLGRDVAREHRWSGPIVTGIVASLLVGAAPAAARSQGAGLDPGTTGEPFVQIWGSILVLLGPVVAIIAFKLAGGTGLFRDPSPSRAPERDR